MSKLISDAQIYALVWASENGGFSELHNAPSCVRSPFDGRTIRLLRTAFDRPQLLGLRRRGLVAENGHGLWIITRLGQHMLGRDRVVERLVAMADATELDQAAANAGRDDR